MKCIVPEITEDDGQLIQEFSLPSSQWLSSIELNPWDNPAQYDTRRSLYDATPEPYDGAVLCSAIIGQVLYRLQHRSEVLISRRGQLQLCQFTAAPILGESVSFRDVFVTMSVSGFVRQQDVPDGDKWILPAHAVAAAHQLKVARCIQMDSTESVRQFIRLGHGPVLFFGYIPAVLQDKPKQNKQDKPLERCRILVVTGYSSVPAETFDVCGIFSEKEPTRLLVEADQLQSWIDRANNIMIGVTDLTNPNIFRV